MLSEIINRNKISQKDIVSVLFTATKDITKAYPAEAARELGITSAGLCCYQEMYVENSLPKCIRVLINVESELQQSEMKHVYLRGAVNLRPDIKAENKKTTAIAIDGPGGSGKSTAARRVADKLGFIYTDTGAMYRSVALYCMEKGCDLSDQNAVIRLLDEIEIKIVHTGETQRILLNGKDVTDLIRTQQVAEGSSKVALIDEVRRKLVLIQREIAAANNVVMDGRDIGTCVLPDAKIKIYLEASAEIRAERRMAELLKMGIPAEYGQILNEITERDKRDLTRKISPLKKADDAVYIDTGKMSEAEVVGEIVDIFRRSV